MDTAHRTTCYFCSKPNPGAGFANAPHWTGSADHAEALAEGDRWLRVDVCRACRTEVRDFPRRPRRPKAQPRPLFGDYATVAMLNGISTDGTGRRIR